MTDRELLEAAAKAAGYEFRVETYRDDFQVLVGGGLWNPLTDDGDSLRLAVKLNIDHGNPGMRLSIDWQPGADPYAATRRAIVRAAAEIGRTMDEIQRTKENS
jgi:hypothetical protein